MLRSRLGLIQAYLITAETPEKRYKETKDLLEVRKVICLKWLLDQIVQKTVTKSTDWKLLFGILGTIDYPTS